MRVIERVDDLRSWTAAYRRAALSIGFVPTLGGLHAGHVELLRSARRECDRVVASVYLNPTQFDSAADLESYPSRREVDIATCREAGVDVLWLGRREDLLRDGFESRVEVERLTRRLCGAGRPGHFRGVATVVTQLLHVVAPHRAYFGLKDYQQSRVVTRMAADLLFDVEIRYVETVRERDGLALSSRNARLTLDERRAATAISRALAASRAAIEAGERRVDAVVDVARRELGHEPLVRPEYVEVCDAGDLEPFASGTLRLSGAGVLVAIAAVVGAVRLIDNAVIQESETRRG